MGARVVLSQENENNPPPPSFEERKGRASHFASFKNMRGVVDSVDVNKKKRVSI